MTGFWRGQRSALGTHVCHQKSDTDALLGFPAWTLEVPLAATALRHICVQPPCPVPKVLVSQTCMYLQHTAQGCQCSTYLSKVQEDSVMTPYTAQQHFCHYTPERYPTGPLTSPPSTYTTNTSIPSHPALSHASLPLHNIVQYHCSSDACSKIRVEHNTMQC